MRVFRVQDGQIALLHWIDLRLLGCTMRLLRSLGQMVDRRIQTSAVCELVECDFHHGPYEPHIRRGGPCGAALLCALSTTSSRSSVRPATISTKFAALRFGFRRLLLGHGQR